MVEYGTVLFDDSDVRSESAKATASEAQAYLVRLEGESAVFLDVFNRITYVDVDDTIATGSVDAPEPDHRLIVVNPAS